MQKADTKFDLKQATLQKTQEGNDLISSVGDQVLQINPAEELHPNVQMMEAANLSEVYLNNVWRPCLSTIGCEVIPQVVGDCDITQIR